MAKAIFLSLAAAPKRMPKPESIPNVHFSEDGSDESVPIARAKVVIVTPAHPTYADVRVFQKEARTLESEGYNVTLFAKAEGRDEPFVDDGIRVVPLDFPSRGHMVSALPGLARHLLREKADIYHLHNPFSLPLVMALKAAGRKVVYDVHEDFTRRVRLRGWIPRLLRPSAGVSVGMLEKVAGSIVDAVIVSQPDVADRFGPKAVLILNAPVVKGALIKKALAFGTELTETMIHPDGAARLVYIGGISRSRGLFNMVELVEKLNNIRPARLWLLGHSDATDISRARELDGWKYVDFLGLRPQHEAFGYISRSDVALALLLDEGGHRDASPNKLYEYMAVGTPFVSSDYAFWREGLADDTGGLFVEPTDDEAPLASILQLLDNPTAAQEMAERGRVYVTDHFNWDREGQKLLDVYEKLLCAS